MPTVQLPNGKVAQLKTPYNTVCMCVFERERQNVCGHTCMGEGQRERRNLKQDPCLAQNPTWGLIS